MLAALRYEMTPLLCIGECAKDKAYAIAPEVIRRQLKVGLFGLSAEQAKRLWIAYQPVWAIGESGVPAAPEYVASVHGMIREQLFALFGGVAKRIPIPYGGSIHPENYVGLACRKDIDGLFIGRSAWDLAQLQKIMTLLARAGF